MDIIKKNYQKIISYGLVVLGIIIFIAILIIRPTKIVYQESYHYDQSSELSKLNSPFSQTIKITRSNPSFLELHFEDDSINQYQYTIDLTHNQETIFEHSYSNEQSNIIRIPTGEAPLNSDEFIELKIECTNNCENAKINLYDTDEGKHPKILLAYYEHDLSFYWYSAFLITIGLTLMPLSKEQK